MNFSELDRADFNPISCKTPNREERLALLRRLNSLRHQFGMPDRVPAQAASVIYLGLCRMKAANESGQNDTLVKECQDVFDLMKPEEPGEGVNCSVFTGGGCRNHMVTFDNAMGFYMPEPRAIRKRALVLLMIGSRFDAANKDTLPPDDSWMDGYAFR